ncbi:MAG: YafY family transcriptional regulator [Streptosporangiaceae bacterium]|nr:YafY family transcriptional regulator [Streptosporangiaceae bacterium]MBV9858469.1 YafY family transcriptional regulator [Streptosporangiaceae bacterium]
MLETSARLLRLLSLLQTPREWTGPQLAERLGVSTRTVRNDVERLRSLGYPVRATPGAAGGYRLGAGASLPPLLLDDEEAVAVAVGLRTAAGGSVTGIEEASMRALTKLEQVLPSRLRRRVAALHAYTVPVPGLAAAVEPDVLAAIAGAARDHEQLRIEYRAHDGAVSLRMVEPHRLVHARGRWYLLAWDTGRCDWRTFRADRMRLRVPNGPRFTPRELPGPDVAAYVSSRLATAMWDYTARVTVHAPAAQIRARLPAAIQVEAAGERSCVISAGSDSPEMLAAYLGMLGADFEVTEPPELVASVRELAARYQRATRTGDQTLS